MISVQHLTKRFGSYVAVDDLSFEVAAGEVLGFLGPNGAGKTTTMRMVTGFLPPSRGSVTIDACDLFKKPIEAKRRLGYLPENPPLYPELTVRQYLNFVAEIKDVPRARRKACVDRAIDRATLREVSGKRIAALSKGFKQRVGLAQAIVHEPKVLILDEPTSSLDPKQRVEVRDLLVGLRGEHTIILSTHILPEVSQITDRVVIINRGKVMAVDSPHNLSQRLRGREEVIVEVGGADPESVRAVVTAVPGVGGVDVSDSDGERVVARIQSDLGTDVRGDVARVLASRWRLLALRSESLSLEEISKLVSRIPIIGELRKKIALSRFSHYFATLHDSGLEVAPSLTLIEKLIDNAYLAKEFRRAVQRVMAGESLSRALRAVGAFPPVVIQMIALGEKTGRMSKALEDVRRYFDGEVDRTIKQSLTLFGPIMMVVLAGAFVLMALAFYLPMFQLLRGIK